MEIEPGEAPLERRGDRAVVVAEGEEPGLELGWTRVPPFGGIVAAGITMRKLMKRSTKEPTPDSETPGAARVVPSVSVLTPRPTAITARSSRSTSARMVWSGPACVHGQIGWASTSQIWATGATAQRPRSLSRLPSKLVRRSIGLTDRENVAPPSPPDAAVEATRLERLIADLVEPARAEALEDLGQGATGIRDRGKLGSRQARFRQRRPPGESRRCFVLAARPGCRRACPTRT
jgi:hypothetical protein